MASKRVTVFGGSGFLGRHIVQCLAAEGTDVRVAVRHPERAAFLERFGRDGRIELVHADVWDESTVARAVRQSVSVINSVGHYVEKGTATFDVVHGQGALHVARQAGQAGAERLIHISGLGADPTSDSPYVRARGIGEVLVKEAFDGVTILRPGVIFGPGDSLFNALAGMARQTPILPLFGMGRTNLQPVFVGDVAEACLRVLADPSTAGKLYELGGPRVYPYKALVRLALEQVDRRRVLVPVPFFVWDT
ncbi:MAG: complex I NDUFA9 subunit family protein, partial [Kiloniellaceae bacterium]